MSFDMAVSSFGFAIDGLNWDASTGYEFGDLLVNGVYFGTFLDPDADAATQALHANSIVGTSSDTFFNIGLSLNAGDVVTFTFGEVDPNLSGDPEGDYDGFRIENVSVPEPGSALVLALAGIGFCARRRR